MAYGISDRMGEAGGLAKGVAKAYSGAALDMAGGLGKKGPTENRVARRGGAGRLRTLKYKQIASNSKPAADTGSTAQPGSVAKRSCTVLHYGTSCSCKRAA
ncbi:hypothetical protein D9M70_603960 [compost metagenome]